MASRVPLASGAVAATEGGARGMVEGAHVAVAWNSSTGLGKKRACGLAARFISGVRPPRRRGGRTACFIASDGCPGRHSGRTNGHVPKVERSVDPCCAGSGIATSIGPAERRQHANWPAPPSAETPALTMFSPSSCGRTRCGGAISTKLRLFAYTKRPLACWFGGRWVNDAPALASADLGYCGGCCRQRTAASPDRRTWR